MACIGMQIQSTSEQREVEYLLENLAASASSQHENFPISRAKIIKGLFSLRLFHIEAICIEDSESIFLNYEM